MIKNIQGLIDFLEKQAEEFDEPTIKQEFQLGTAGVHKNRISILKESIPGLPESYIEWVKNYNLNGVCIGYFGLSPLSHHSIDMVQNLIDAYNDSFFPKEFMAKYNLYQIGFCNTDLVCITGKSEKFDEGTIVYVDEGYDIFNPSPEQIFPLTNSFETFLLIAGNLNQLHQELIPERMSYDEGISEFRKVLEYFKIPQEYHKVWLSLV